MTPDMQEALQSVGEPVSFSDGDVLRQKGAFAPDLLLITGGQVNCILSEADNINVSLHPGAIVGEVGFLTGQAATATLQAVGPVQALSLDARALQRLQRDCPSVAAVVLRHLAHLLRDRSVQNEDLLAETDPEGTESIIVVRCSTLDQRRTAQRVRYDIQCLEEGQDFDGTDHDEGLIADDMDRSGTAFLAFTGVQAVGMMRVHAATECGTGVKWLHGVLADRAPLEEVMVITVVAIRQSFMPDDVLEALFGAVIPFAKSSGARRALLHSTVEFEPRYQAHGFQRTTKSENSWVVMERQI